jgi:hypothetical protein
VQPTDIRSETLSRAGDSVQRQPESDSRHSASSMISNDIPAGAHMDIRKHVPVMLGEHWIYVVGGVISIATLAVLYLDPGPIRWSAWW